MAVSDYNKAIVAGIVALGAALQVAQVQGGITGTEWASALIGALITGLLTWSVTNSGTFAWLENQEQLLTSFAKAQTQKPPA